MNCTLKFFSITCVAFALASCSGTTTHSTRPSPKPEPQQETLASLLERAQNTTDTRSTQWQIEAAEIALAEKQWPLLRALVSQINQTDLTPSLTIKLALINSSLQQHDNNHATALAALNSPSAKLASQTVSNELASAYLWQLASVQAKLGNIQPALDSLILREELISPSAAPANHQQIWRLLLLLTKPQIESLISNTNSVKLLGWLELASIYRDGDADVTLQADSLSAWQQRWPDHAANKDLPGGLKKLQQAAENLPKRVLVALPTSGPLRVVGQTLRDGILFAYWRQKDAGLPTPQLTFIDSHPLDSDAIINIARDNDILIGPFDKNKASSIATRANELPKTLLLNVVNDQPLSDNLISFGLNPEDEAAQIADRAILESGARALIIAPNNALGDRLQGAFVNRWLELGGTISESGRYEDGRDISNTIKTALNIDKSEMRKRRLALNTGLSLQFEPRRRADIDMAAIFGKPQEARSISPLFAFHFAEDIPLYTSSMAYSGEVDATADKDLEGVRFNDIPWLFDQAIENPELQNVRFRRLFALGIDAYRLHQRFDLLTPESGMEFSGATGTLRLNQERQIVRSLDWAEFSNGLAKPIPAIQ